MDFKTTTKQLIFASLITLSLVFAANAQEAKKAENNCSEANGLTEAEISEILEAHKKARADVNLPPLTWSCKLANLAQVWANRGVFEHHTDFEFGENIAGTEATDASPNVNIQNWLLEKPFWDNAGAKCQTGKVCYHYTQIVWKDTTEVGCGINRKATGKTKALLVCNYDPAGNYPGPAY